MLISQRKGEAAAFTLGLLGLGHESSSTVRSKHLCVFVCRECTYMCAYVHACVCVYRQKERQERERERNTSCDTGKSW